MLTRYGLHGRTNIELNESRRREVALNQRVAELENSLDTHIHGQKMNLSLNPPRNGTLTPNSSPFQGGPTPERADLRCQLQQMTAIAEEREQARLAMESELEAALKEIGELRTTQATLQHQVAVGTQTTEVDLKESDSSPKRTEAKLMDHCEREMHAREVAMQSREAQLVNCENELKRDVAEESALLAALRTSISQIEHREHACEATELL